MNIKNELKKEYIKNDDFVERKINTFFNKQIVLLFFESLTSSDSIYNFVIKNIYLHNKDKITKIEDLICAPKIKKVKNKKDASYLLENGYCLVFFNNEMLAVEAKASIDRGITMSQSEPNMFGSKDSFCENYQKNLGVIKRRIKSQDLKIDSLENGYYTKTKISVMYIKDKVNVKALKKIKYKLSNQIHKEIIDSFDLNNELKLNKIFPSILKTEKPAIAANFLLKGHIIVLVDNTPFVLIIDAKLKDFINPRTTDKFVKVLRWVCFFLTILTPAFYISLINFNQEAIPTSLLINFSMQRSSVPFPAVIEAFIMLLVCEILRETDLRFPNNYGSSASILGALVLGDAAVNAGIVSPIMIIVVAITFITNLIFSETKLVWAIRILRVSFLLLSSLFGIYGLFLAFITSLALISNTKMNEGIYI